MPDTRTIPNAPTEKNPSVLTRRVWHPACSDFDGFGRMLHRREVAMKRVLMIHTLIEKARV
jgi:hypothetical protein